jgi:hypothetical protein
MQLVSPAKLHFQATAAGFQAEDRATLTLSSGKQFLFQTFRL